MNGMEVTMPNPLAAAATIALIIFTLSSDDYARFADPRSSEAASARSWNIPSYDDTDELRNTDGDGASPRPNILFLLLDQWRPDYDGHHSHTHTGPLPLNMPFLKEMGKRGTRFTQAYVPSPFCGPSRACVASGKEYDATGVMSNRMWSVQFTTVYKLLRDLGGYHTMTAGKDDLYDTDPVFPKYEMRTRTYESLDIGFEDAIRSDGKVRVTKKNVPDEPFRHFLNNKMVTMLNGTVIPAMTAYTACMKGKGPEEGCDASSFTEEIYPDDFVRDKAIEILERKPSDKEKPWFLQVNFPGPHSPVVATARMAASVMDRQWPMPIDNTEMYLCPQNDREREDPTMDRETIKPPLSGVCNYAAELEHLDMLMYSIVQHVGELGELDNTIVIVAGDHGENLGDNGEGGKGMPWHASVSTPLLISGPGIRQGMVHEGAVTTLDLGGTWLDYGGVNELVPDMTTMSLRSILTGDDTLPRRPHIWSGYDQWRIVVKDMPTSPEDPTITSYKLICCHGKKFTNSRGKSTYKGCGKGAPKSATPYPSSEPWQLMLYDTRRDPGDLKPLEFERPYVIEELLPLLPEGWCSA